MSEDYKQDKEEKKEIPIANIVVTGITGSGKSTLVNAICHDNNSPIRIWDTVEFEIDSVKTEQSMREISEKLEEKSSRNENECIHAIWYCINSGTNRYQEGEIRLIETLHSLKVPIIIVLTQCAGDPKIADHLEELIRSDNKSCLLVPVTNV
ncbi:GTPase domain-containing protein [Butyrivibrio sp. AE3009]|uniref:GTPase domain-containing protein n=1 Tax=Butyrivibrio sp. AE3009 TaxID=1280666 RepID=UPI0003B644D5|nr:GTPase domain-containing protein [Butyrivibrio sp. AE3009]